MHESRGMRFTFFAKHFGCHSAAAVILQRIPGDYFTCAGIECFTRIHRGGSWVTRNDSLSKSTLARHHNENRQELTENSEEHLAQVIDTDRGQCH